MSLFCLLKALGPPVPQIIPHLTFLGLLLSFGRCLITLDSQGYTSGEPLLMASLPFYTKKSLLIVTKQIGVCAFRPAPAALKPAKWSWALGAPVTTQAKTSEDLSSPYNKEKLLSALQTLKLQVYAQLITGDSILSFK